MNLIKEEDGIKHPVLLFFVKKIIYFLGMDNSEEFSVIQLQRPAPRGRFGPDDEVKDRLHRQALQRLSGLNRALAPFVYN
ncbi:MAG: hypothetical protein Q8898_01000 [Bacillota bacterium]|nr:hypothetical protein [Bacillota bacterium]